LSKKKKLFEDEKEMPISSISAAEDDMMWNKTGSWRNVKPYYDPKTSPCIASCPAGENIQGYIELAKQEKYEEAVRLIWEDNPFPSICGRVCYHPCMDGCARGPFDGSVFIPAIERFLGDYAIENNLTVSPTQNQHDHKIAVIGGGPAGLSTAFFLTRKGFSVTVFEAKDQLGGVLRYGIPEYRLPKDILDAEINRIKGLGVEFRTNTVVGRDISLEELSGYSAFFVGIGLQKSRGLGVDNENIDGVIPGLEFLEMINTGKKIEVGDNVVVVGGGNTAMDVARSAIRLGADVTVVYRRTRDEMPAIEDEVEEAMSEGVKFKFLATPVEVSAENSRLSGIRCQEMKLGAPDDSGRRRPVPKENAYFTMPTSSLLVAIGEQPDSEMFEKLVEIEWGLIVADEYGKTNNRKIFAGGDIVSGASTVVNAVARGRGAAELIHAQLTGTDFDPKTMKKVVAIADLNSAYFFHKDRALMGHSDGANADNPFVEVNTGLTCDQVQDELSRCYSCGVCDGCDNCYVFCPDVAISRQDGVYTIDYDYCKGCLICVQECPRGILSTESEAK
jgi:NADPH-dependent glutamate synthase beta subunit-like oxidoreductase/NAD-dependent dihydropyrimidine dehydrogenase PreA subunit